MPRTISKRDHLTDLLDASRRPMYAVDSRRRIAYCNSVLAEWLGLKRERIVSRLVEYHSEPAIGASEHDRETDPPLTDLCPPPQALAGEQCSGTISCMARDGHLIHRRAEFIPLGGPDKPAGVLALLATDDLSPHELAGQVSTEPTADELHRAIRRFRRAEASRFAVETLLGETAAIRKVRAQVIAAADSGANVLVCGRAGSGRGHIARAIHYRSVGDAPVKLLHVDCEVLNDDLLRRNIGAASQRTGDPRRPATLLLENLELLSESLQSQLLAAIGHGLPARIIAIASIPASPPLPLSPSPALTLPLEPALLDAISTITIHVPRLTDRLDDLPILAQFFLEECNHDSGKQVGSLRPEALDLLALHTWPGELDELRACLAAAHRTASSHEIRPSDLPAIVHHASHAAAHPRRQPERINLDDLLAKLEREALVRALDQAGGNKTAAAELLGMTRPRLYRRLVQLGLAGPEFIERDETDEAP